MNTHEEALTEHFAVRMEAARIEKGWSLSQLAEAIGLPRASSGYLSKIERGENKPSFPRAVLIARALGINMEDFNDDR